MPAAIVFPPSTSTFRDMSDAISPTYLLGPNGLRYRYSMSVMWDAMADAMTYAVLARYPTTCPPDALAWIGQDRQIDAGYQESAVAYQARLIQWLDLWGYAGLPTSVLLALLAYVTPALIQVRTVDNTGNWNTYAAGSVPFPPSQQVPTPPVLTPAEGNWRWDSASDPYGYGWQWWRMWVVLYSTGGTPWAAPSLTWSPATGSVTVAVTADATYGSYYTGSGGSGTSATDFDWDGGSTVPSGWPGSFVAVQNDSYYGTHYVGVGGPPATYTTPAWDWAGSVQQAADIVTQCNKWRRGGCWIPNVIVSYDSTMFDPTQSFGSSKLPDGTWGHWGKVASDATYGSYYAAARPVSSTCSILNGTPVTLE